MTDNHTELVRELRNWADDDRPGERGPFSHHKDIQFKAAAAITALVGEVERLKAECQMYAGGEVLRAAMEDANFLRSKREALRAEVAALRKDAEKRK